MIGMTEGGETVTMEVIGAATPRVTVDVSQMGPEGNSVTVDVIIMGLVLRLRHQEAAQGVPNEARSWRRGEI